MPHRRWAPLPKWTRPGEKIEINPKNPKYLKVVWALATFYLEFPDEVFHILATHTDSAVRRMAVRKLCESRRVPALAKAQAKQIVKERKGT